MLTLLAAVAASTWSDGFLTYENVEPSLAQVVRADDFPGYAHPSLEGKIRPMTSAELDRLQGGGTVFAKAFPIVTFPAERELLIRWTADGRQDLAAVACEFPSGFLSTLARSMPWREGQKICQVLVRPGESPSLRMYFRGTSRQGDEFFVGGLKAGVYPGTWAHFEALWNRAACVVFNQWSWQGGTLDVVKGKLTKPPAPPEEKTPPTAWRFFDKRGEEFATWTGRHVLYGDEIDTEAYLETPDSVTGGLGFITRWQWARHQAKADPKHASLRVAGTDDEGLWLEMTSKTPRNLIEGPMDRGGYGPSFAMFYLAVQTKEGSGLLRPSYRGRWPAQQVPEDGEKKTDWIVGRGFVKVRLRSQKEPVEATVRGYFTGGRFLGPGGAEEPTQSLRITIPALK